MAIKIKFKKDIKNSSILNYVLFCDENFSIYNLKGINFLKNSYKVNSLISSYKNSKKNFLHST